MRKARFIEQQIIAVIKSVESARTIKGVSREAGISEATYYNWKFKDGDMEPADIKKIKYSVDETRCFKQIFAYLSLVNRPRELLNMTPEEYRLQHNKAGISKNEWN